MARASKKENKTVYQLRREELGLSRDKASELLEVIPPERIERRENTTSTPSMAAAPRIWATLIKALKVK